VQKITSVLLLVIIAFVGNATAQAQNTAEAQIGTIKGVVKDFSNNVVPGVMITLRNIDTKQEFKVVTNETGEYRFQVPPGVYNLDTYLPGFEPLHRPDLKLNSGETLSQQLKLTVAGYHPDRPLFQLIS
jgi:hypothetical protein